MRNQGRSPEWSRGNEIYALLKIGPSPPTIPKPRGGSTLSSLHPSIPDNSIWSAHSVFLPRQRRRKLVALTQAHRLRKGDREEERRLEDTLKNEHPDFQKGKKEEKKDLSSNTI